MRKALIASAVFAALGFGSASAQDTIKVGIILPRSGYLAQAGQSCHRGALIAPKVLADFGYKVELVHVDIESNPDVARNQAEKVINDGAKGLAGGTVVNFPKGV